jgi:diguanylate cyclase (GGDEF)-like protein/PAS domain S-box-containing protein
VHEPVLPPSSRAPAPWRTVLLLLGAIVAVVATALLIEHLHERATERLDNVRVMAQAEADVNLESAIIGRTVAGARVLRDAPAQLRMLQARAARAVELADRHDSDGDLGPVGPALARYHDTLGRTLRAAESDRWRTAQAIERDELQPAFSVVSGMFASARPRERREALNASASARRDSALLLVGTVLLMLLGLLRFERSRRRLERTAVEDSAARAALESRRASEARYRSLLAETSDALLVLDRDGVVQETLGPLRELVGDEADRIAGQSLIAQVHPADRDRVELALAEPGGRAAPLELRVVAGEEWLPVDAVVHALPGRIPGAELVVALRDATERRRREDELRHRAFHDPVTGLPNRALLVERLQHALIRGRRLDGLVAVLFLDLDDFKAVNDRFGHAAGDELLHHVGRRLRDSLRAGDTVARLGGDEFAVLIEAVSSPAEPVRVAAQVLEAFEQPIALGGVELVVRPSIGVAVGDSREVASDALLRDADLAMYAAKQRGGGRYMLWDRRLERLAQDAVRGRQDAGRLQAWADNAEERRQEIHARIQRPEGIVVHTQPILDLRTGTVSAWEALARFPGSERSPAAWFAEARRCGLGAELEIAALRAALSRPLPAGDARLSVNVSPSTVVSGELARALTTSPLHRIILEITEHELVAGGDEVQDALCDLRDRGALLAVDDAGAGYAGLRHLTQLRPDVIKLDRGLVDGVSQDTAKSALIDSLVHFADGIGADVCAEGIEELDDLAALADLGVSHGQGYAIARPARGFPEADLAAAEVCRRSLRRLLRDGAEAGAAAASGDRRLEVLTARLSRIGHASELDSVMEIIALQLGADAVAFSRLDPRAEDIVTLCGQEPDPDGGPGRIVKAKVGERFPLAAFPATRRVLATGEALQIRAGDPDADPAEVALLRTQGLGSLLMVPVAAGGRPLGLLEGFRREDRAWSRIELHQGRIVGYMLGAVLERLAHREAWVREALDAADASPAHTTVPQPASFRRPATVRRRG